MSSANTDSGEKGDIIDWQLCVICQEYKKEILQCPSNLNPGHVGYGKGYASLSENIERFLNLGISLPVPLKLESLKGESTSIMENLTKNRDKWHKSCKVKFDETQLSRAAKRLLQPENPESTCKSAPPSKVTRKSTDNLSVLDKNKCFFLL